MRLKARSIEEKPKNRTDIDTEKYEPGVTSFELYSVTEGLPDRSPAPDKALRLKNRPGQPHTTRNSISTEARNRAVQL